MRSSLNQIACDVDITSRARIRIRIRVRVRIGVKIGVRFMTPEMKA